MKKLLNGECVIVAIIVGIFAIAAAAACHWEFVEQPRAFEAWKKQTGNPKGLEFSEWRLLFGRDWGRRSNMILIFGN